MPTDAGKRDIDAAGIARGLHLLQEAPWAKKRQKPYHFSHHFFDPRLAEGHCGYSFQGRVEGLAASMRVGRTKPVYDIYHGGGMLGALLVEWRNVGVGLGPRRNPAKWAWLPAGSCPRPGRWTCITG